jgi:hypothetical protein
LGGLGWVALAPFELFHPWWGHGFHGEGFGRGYGNYTNINIVRNTNITNIYRNSSIRGAAITASANSFGRGTSRWNRASQSQLRNASLFRGGIPATPTQASRQFSNRQAAANPRLASAANHQFFQHQSAPQSARQLSAQQQLRNQPTSRQSFAGAPNTRGSGFARAGQTGLSTAQRGQPPTTSRGGFSSAPQNFGGAARNNSAPQNLHGVPPNLRPQTPGRSNYGASTQGSNQASNSGWHRFGEPGTSNSFRSTPAAPREPSGWHSFGQPQAGYSRSFASPNYGGNYQSRPLGPSQPAARPPQSSSGYRGGYNYGARPAYGAPGSGGMNSYRAPSMPHYSAPSAPHFSAPSTPHYSAPHSSAPSRGGGGGSFHGGGGGSPRGGGGSPGGGHSSSGGHRGR